MTKRCIAVFFFGAALATLLTAALMTTIAAPHSLAALSFDCTRCAEVCEQLCSAADPDPLDTIDNYRPLPTHSYRCDPQDGFCPRP